MTLRVGDVVRTKDKTFLPVRFTVTAVIESRAEMLMNISAIRPYADKYEETVAYFETHPVLQSAFTRVR